MQQVDEANFDDRPDGKEQRHHEKAAFAPLKDEEESGRVDK